MRGEWKPVLWGLAFFYVFGAAVVVFAHHWEPLLGAMGAAVLLGALAAFFKFIER